MKRQNVFKITALAILLIILLVQINHDIFQYTCEMLLNRTFSDSSDAAGEYVLVQDKALNPGEYSVHILGESTGADSGFRFYGDGELIAEGTFPNRRFLERIPIPVETSIRNFQISAIFGTASSELKIETIEIHAPFVPQKDVILRHLVISLFLIFLFGLLLLRFLRPQTYTRIFGKFSKPSSEFIFFFLLFLTAFTSAPFFNSDYIQTNDGYYHMLRIEGIKTSLEAGIFPARIHLFILNDAGYGEGFFYPDLFLYFPAILRLLGFGILSAYKIFVCFSSFLAILSAYFVTAKIARSRYAGIIAAVLLAFSSYRLIDMFYRGAVGEILSFIFIPWVVYGLFKIYTGESDGWVPLAAGFSGLVFSHMISLALAGLAVLIFVLLNIGKTLRNGKILLSLIKATGLTLLITIIFWLPMLEQLRRNEVIGNVLYSGLSYAIDEGRLLSLQELFAGFASWVTVKPFLGYPLLFIPFIRLLLRRKEASHPGRVKIADWILAFGMFTTIMATSLFPWRYFAWIYNRIQFPWRMLVIASPLLAIAGGILCDAFLKKSHRQTALIMITGFCVAAAQPFFTEVYANHLVSGYGFDLENNRVMGAEYIPQNAELAFIDKNMNTILSSDDSFENLRFKRSGLQFSFDFRLAPNSTGITTFEVPLLFYYGYQGTLADRSGNTQPLDVYQGTHGLTTVDTEGITEGTISVFYRKTCLQKIADGISLCTLLLCVVYYLRRWQNSKARNFRVRTTQV